MNFLNQDLDRLIRLRKSHYKKWIIRLLSLSCIVLTVRFLLMSIKDHFDYLQNMLNGSFIDLLFNFGQLNQVHVVTAMMPLFCLYNTYNIVDKSDIRFWDPLMTVLTRDNWAEFVKSNFNFKPTFSIIEILMNPGKSLTNWKIVFSKFFDYRQVYFSHSTKLFPYMSVKIRVAVLTISFAIFLLSKLIYYAICKLYFINP